MARLIEALRALLGLGFHAFLAAYWYLVHGMYPVHALVAGVLSYVIYLALRNRVPGTLPQPALLLLSGFAFFLMLNPLVSLHGLTLLAWFTGWTIVFRLSFARLQNSRWKSGALLASYALFLALPLGIPRLGSSLPTAQEGEPLDVAIVGAGFGGITMGKELLDAGITNFQIFEGAPEVGGTWWHNRYPGLHVDVQSALYSLSYFPNPNWSKMWAPRKELLEYAVELADATGVRPFIQFNSWVSSVRFDDELGLWQVSQGERQVLARHLVLANGGLHIPNTPDFAGADDYRGVTFHSARWREDVDLADKRIAVIGSGASAVQIIPEIAKVAARVDMYQRTPNWVAPQDNREVSQLRKWVHAYVPMAYKLDRLRIHVLTELGFRAVFPLESSIRDRVEQQLTAYIRDTVDDDALVPELIPDYEFGCKRPLVTQYFYPSLNRDNVNVVTEGIERLTPHGIQSSKGTERDYDIIVMATGYHLAGTPFPVEGRNGMSLDALWQEKPEAYEGMMVHGFPNLHLMAGPNSGFIGSFLIHLESAAAYHMQVIRRTENDELIEPRLEAQQAYNRNLQAELQQTVWAGSCKSWYKLDNGHVIANHPHPASRVIYDRSRPRWDDFLVSEPGG
jgi:cation diffusion facilitator CzcD-associated flavoprotein CzcO